ncbi:MAG: hypothetical protein ABIO46_12640 [Chitinophagales bacterium]
MKRTTFHIVYGIVFFVFFFIRPVTGQQLSNIRNKTVSFPNDTLHIDTLSLIPGSVILKDAVSKAVISVDQYTMDELHSLMIWKGELRPDSVSVTYKVFPVAFSKEVYHKDFSRLNKQDSLSRLPIIYSLQELSPGNTLDLGAMNYNGSFTRGITFGNNQDLVVNSGFNLQLQGKLAGDVEVLAALSDNNIPIQPEGNTQQLQEFDKVFIQLKKNKSALVVGDYELSKPEGYFMNYYKKLQGANFSTVYDAGPDLQLKTNAGIALVKGKYASNTFLGQEGNQGPYRLTGNSGETFIIILAGTERVFIDGLLLERGADRDYVIDYNSGEIIFTPTRLITKDKRITVEFQYSERAYLRSIFFAGQQFQQDKSTIRVNFYSEQDAKNQPVQQELSDSQKLILSEVGDSVQEAYFQSVDSVPFTADRILYRKTDSLGYVIYVYSTDPEEAKYALGFSYTGIGKGNYVISTNLVNGRVYNWVAPLNGIPQGLYEPVIPLIAPQRIQLLTIGGDYSFTENAKITLEAGLSNQDANTFSEVNNNDNAGASARVGWNQNIPLNHRKDKASSLLVNAQYEFASRTFKPIERYRPVEFERNWNITGNVIPANENLASVNLNLQRMTTGNLEYAFSLFNRTGNYTGINNSLNGNYEHKGFRASVLSSYLVSETDVLSTEFLRPSIDLSQSFRFLKGAVVGVSGEQENNRLFSKEADTLSAISFYWNEGRIYFRSSDTAKFRFNVDYASRIDYSPQENQFEKATIGNTVNAGAELLANPNSILRWNVTYRKLNVTDTLLTVQRPDESLLGRLGYDLQVKKGFITSNTLYELGSVQEQKKEFAYTPVPDGTGVYTWIDYNGDGVQQINEFEIAAFQTDAKYIKVLLPTNQFVKAYSSLFNESLTINPRSLWKTPQGLQEVVARFSGQTTLQVNKKTLAGDFSSQFNPFLLNVADTLLISNSSLVSGFLYFNRSNPKYGIDFSYQNNRSKVLLTNGVESRNLRDYGVRWRWNITRKFSTILKVNQNQKGYSTAYFPQNNYLLNGYFITPQFSYQPSNVFRMTVSYSYSNSKNTISDGAGEKALNNKLTLDVKYNVVAKSVINAGVVYANVNYTGTNNTPVQYAMLEGLQSGQNYLLNVSFDRKLSNFIEMSLSYEGRKTGNATVVNTGRAQVRAIF